MIPRTRPYIDIQNAINFLDHYNQLKHDVGEDIFLNSGQACLKTFLSCIGCNKRVGIQVFTCPTVLDAILSSGDIPVFMDINIDFFTTTLDIIQTIVDSIDILVLSHLFGIPNPDYLQIKKLCEEKKVIIIDDLCQTFKAKVNGSYIEDLSDNYFYSFFYDKPISCASGGMLKVCDKYIDRIKTSVLKLPQESNSEGKHKIQRLINMQMLLSPDIYYRDFRTYNIMETYILSHFPYASRKWYIALHSFLSSPINRIAAIILPKNDYSKKNARLSDIQIAFIYYLFNSFRNRTNILVNYYKKNSLDIPKYLNNKKIECSCSQRAIIKKKDIFINNAEVALFNWPCLLDERNSYPNADYVIRNFVNIPIIEI